MVPKVHMHYQQQIQRKICKNKRKQTVLSREKAKSEVSKQYMTGYTIYTKKHERREKILKILLKTAPSRYTR
jgi:hypothetical protein